MAKVLNLFFGGKRKKLARPDTVRIPKPSAQQRLFR